MARRKSVLQRLSLVSSVISFLLAVIAGIMLYLRVQSVGMDNPVSASLMASTFFFLCVGAVLAIMGKADLPDFKFNHSDRK